MAEELKISNGTKEEKYTLLYEQIKSVVSSETDVLANMANVTSMLHFTFDFLWTGFYRVVESQLVLGPFQGPLACSRIKYGKGVCGTAWAESRTIIVDDVEQFPGHIACSSRSRSEIVVPIVREGVVKYLLDIDSAELSIFDSIDRQWLEKIVLLL